MIITGVLIGMLFINSIIPHFIVYNIVLEKIIMYLSYGLMIIQLFLIFSWIYGFWILCKAINDVYESQEKPRKMGLIFLFFLPFTFGFTHRNIRKLIK